MLRRAFVAASVAWAAALPIAALVSNRGAASALAYVGVATAYAIGSVVCHQLPSRSFHLGAAPFPVCARCTGIYFGAAAATMMCSARRGGPVWPPWAATRGGPYATRVVLSLAIVPTLLTLIYEWTAGDVPSNTIRFLAGLPLGAAVAWIVVAASGDANQVN